MMHNRNGAKIGRKQSNGRATDMKDEVMTGKKVTMTRAVAASNAASASQVTTA